MAVDESTFFFRAALGEGRVNFSHFKVSESLIEKKVDLGSHSFSLFYYFIISFFFMFFLESLFGL